MNVTITGDSFTVISNLDVEQIKKIGMYQPSALVLKDKDNNDLFALSYDKASTGCIDRHGVIYSTCVGKKAAFTALLAHELSDTEKKEIVTNILAVALQNLEKIEKQIAEACVTLDKLIATVAAKIVVTA